MLANNIKCIFFINTVAVKSTKSVVNNCKGVREINIQLTFTIVGSKTAGRFVPSVPRLVSIHLLFLSINVTLIYRRASIKKLTVETGNRI